ncbi:hypothetical protein ACVIHI_004134 [Bradyrhizobium sp. USDA 4524]|uniref:hypothetical protein n=1 Tax=unclassified Bradyrhizobium TaxID=2631580 RepID=UPI0035C744F9|nr:hypothetical protein [Bradyrhizobium sp. USDA 4538]MCP1903511.1 hypothetical protein [Bradyrhizobium sp. USDA 4537]MCP1990832.1 hypothetical protein [Bradyrhizobium sp. USDA 4539]
MFIEFIFPLRPAVSLTAGLLHARHAFFRQLVLLEIAQPAHVIAVALNRLPDLLANPDDPLLALAPFALSADVRHWKSFFHNEEIAPDVEIHLDHIVSQKAESIRSEQSAARRNATGSFAPACEYRGEMLRSLFRQDIFWLDVVRMPHPTTNDYLDEYDRELDEIVAACDGDVRSALRALLLVNEQLEHILNCLNAELVDHVSRHHRRQTLH